MSQIGFRRYRRVLTRALGSCAAMVAVAACSPAVVLNDLLVPDDGFDLEADRSYGADERQRLDIYVPRPKTDTLAPVVVFFYGGSWKSGQRNYYRFVGEAFARRGFVVAVPDYRLYPDVRFPAFMNDGAMAVRWVRDHAHELGGDPDRIILMGHSAGAHIAALLLTDDRYLEAAGVPEGSIRGMVGLAGPYAIDPRSYDTTRPIFAGLSDPDEARPVAQVNDGVVPMLLAHGADDSTVRAVNSELFAAAVNAAGGEAAVVQYPGVGHIGIVLSLSAPLRGRDSVYADVVRFLEQL